MWFDSHRQVASGSVYLTIFDNNTLWMTVSNAAVRSRVTHTVRCGSFLWLKPVTISLVSFSKAEVVECPGRKPYWSADWSSWRLEVREPLWLSLLDREATEEYLSGFGIGMALDDFQIDGIRQDVMESLKSAVRYSISLDPKCFMWKKLSLSGSKAQVLLQLLIHLVTWSVVNATAEVNDFRQMSLDTNRVFREEVYLPSFEVTVSWNRFALGKILESRQMWFPRSQPSASIYHRLPW